MKKIFGFMLAILLGSSSYAAGESGVLVSVGLLKYDRETDGPQIGVGKDINTHYDLKLGYLIGNDIYVGGIYSIHNQDYGSAQLKRTLYGLTAGYHSSGWYLDASYFLGGEWDRETIVYTKPSGLGVDIGYRFMVNSNFLFGIQGSYKSYTFKEYEANNVTVKEDNKVKSEMYPMLVLGVIF